jgi:hypothetical protein
MRFTTSGGAQRAIFWSVVIALPGRVRMGVLGDGLRLVVIGDSRTVKVGASTDE